MVLIPTTSPEAFANGPPELPGASRSWLTTQESLKRWTTPVLAAPVNPNGFPTATTNSPTRGAFASPIVAACRPEAST